MDLSIAIVNWNTRDLLRQCLESIVNTVGDVECEIIVVDNGSTDESAAIVSTDFPEVRLIRNEDNRGFAAANNQAVRVSLGRHILLLNSDTIVLPGALAAMVRFADRHPRVGIVGACLLNRDGTLQASWAEFPTLLSELLGKNFRVRRSFPSVDGTAAFDVDWVGGACLLMRRAAFEQVGYLDDRFFMYSEEADWCFRAKKKGWVVCYYPGSQVVHLGGQSARRANARMKTELYRSKVTFFYKHYGANRARLLCLALQVSFVAKASFGRVLWILLRDRSGHGERLRQDSMAAAREIGQHLKRLSSE